jgi:hypothetical protein
VLLDQSIGSTLVQDSPPSILQHPIAEDLNREKVAKFLKVISKSENVQKANEKNEF